MLPMPCSPSASWAMYRARLKQVFDGADLHVCAAFWLFGLINNVLYVIILSAALDLVGPSVPKGVVLLADVIPSFLTKLVAPYFIHIVPYHVRIWGMAGISTCGMLLIALTPASRDGANIGVKLLGVMLASLSSGAGELSFLGLTHYYGPFSLAAWGSGTGGAGIIGAWAYVIATTSIGLSVRTSLLSFSFLPVVMIASFFLILPRGPLTHGTLKQGDYQTIDSSRQENDDEAPGEEDVSTLEADTLLSSSSREFASQPRGTWAQFRGNLSHAQTLFLPYMLPLLIVYVAEYTINQGVAPTLLFPLKSTPFHEYRSFYPTYNAIYQIGVFLSRSSTPFFRIHALYLPSFLQIINLAILTAHAMYDFLPNVYFVFAIVFWEGLLGGLVYVSTFAEITDNVPHKDREFSLSATSMSDSGGISIAGGLSMVFEVWLCDYQVAHGRDYCRKL